MTDKHKICLVTHIFPYNRKDYKGIFVLELAVELKHRGHEVHVVTPMRPGAVKEEIQDGIRIHRFAYWGWRKGIQLGDLKGTPVLLLGSFMVLGIIKCVAIILRFHLNMIHAYWVVPGGLIGLIAGRMTGLPVVATAAGSDLYVAPRHNFTRLLITLTLKWLNKLVAVSTSIEQAALKLGVPEDRCTVIHGPVGIDLGTITKRRGQSESEKEYGQCLLFVGNLTPPKRADTIIGAMRRVVEVFKDCHLILIGEGDLRPALETLTHKLGLARRVHFHGAMEHGQVLRMLQSADIFVHCSDYEGLGIAIMEGMGAGLPVVASRVGGVPDLVRDGETGFMVSADDVEGYADKILLLLSDDDLRKRLGANGRRFAESRLDKKKILLQLEAVYNELLN